VYEWLKVLASSFRHEDDKNRQPAWVSLLLGSTSKVVAATVTYPYQVIKSRMQQREFIEASQIPKVSFGGVTVGKIDVSSSARRYDGMLDCMVKIFREHGIQGFLRGVIPNAMKVAPSAAITFVVYEECMKFMKSDNK
jgi:solute carrier family 25 folate transporter 32